MQINNDQSRQVRCLGLFCSGHVCIQLVDLGLEQRFQLGPLGLQSWSQQAVFNGELFRVEVNIFHLHQGEKNTDGERI